MEMLLLARVKGRENLARAILLYIEDDRAEDLECRAEFHSAGIG
jgi:hypothetical protein